MSYQPTDEQLAIVDAFRTGRNLAIEAGAGTGKTSTLQMLGEDARKTGCYVAFNKAIVVEAAQKFPSNVQCSTAHSLAFRQVGRRYSHRLNSGRMTSTVIAEKLDLESFGVLVNSKTKVIRPPTLAGIVMRGITNFCNSADLEPSPEHIPYQPGLDTPDGDGNRTWTNNLKLREHLAKPLTEAWEDLARPNGELRFSHDCYLKLWQLGGPRIPGQFIEFDEAQDASPVMLDAVRQQRAQKVFVGDSNQQIYGWRGAINALASIDAADRRLLTHSFRFGPPIAGLANLILETLPTEMRLTGRGGPSVIERIARPNAVLCRTNGGALERVLAYQRLGMRVALVGDGTELLQFARAVDELRERGWTPHPELCCFTSWEEVVAYVEDDSLGGELALLVKLVEKYGTPAIRRALENMPAESHADVTISTVHKAKGREWDAVSLHSDFAIDPDSDEEWRLLYVAVTRARHQLDVVMCEPVWGMINPARPV